MSTASRKAKPRRAAVLPYWLREFALIRLQAIAFVLTVAVAVSAVSASRWYWHQARDFQAWAQQKRNDARDRLFYAETEKREIRLYQPQYAALRERGLIGQENRLDWVDAIRQVQEQRKLMPVSYELEPQQPVRMDGGTELGGYRLHGSRMKLHMDLLHEGDLFVLLDDLRQRSFYSAQECSIKRAASGLPSPLAPTLSADCTLNWLTLSPAPTRRIAQQWRPQ